MPDPWRARRRRRQQQAADERTSGRCGPCRIAPRRLVEHEQPAVRPALRSDGSKLGILHAPDATFALDRLQKNGDDVVVAGSRLKGLRVVQRQSNESVEQWSEAGLYLGVAGC